MTTAVHHDAHLQEDITLVTTVVVTIAAQPMVTVYVTPPPEKKQVADSRSTTSSMARSTTASMTRSTTTSATTVYIPTQVKLGQTVVSVLTSHSTMTLPSVSSLICLSCLHTD